MIANAPICTSWSHGCPYQMTVFCRNFLHYCFSPLETLFLVCFLDTFCILSQSYKSNNELIVHSEISFKVLYNIMKTNTCCIMLPLNGVFSVLHFFLMSKPDVLWFRSKSSMHAVLILMQSFL